MFHSAWKLALPFLLEELQPGRIIGQLCDPAGSRSGLLILLLVVYLTAPRDRKADSERGTS